MWSRSAGMNRALGWVKNRLQPNQVRRKRRPPSLEISRAKALVRFPGSDQASHRGVQAGSAIALRSQLLYLRYIFLGHRSYTGVDVSRSQVISLKQVQIYHTLKTLEIRLLIDRELHFAFLNGVKNICYQVKGPTCDFSLQIVAINDLRNR